MTGLDTNILIRYLTLDDTKQAELAIREIEAAAESGEKLGIQPLVLCELVWVLESAYSLAKSEILTTLERILATGQFEVARKEVIWAALDDYRRGRADFADYYLGRENEISGASVTLTFDKALRDTPRFRVLVP
jgi:predicted nucleic-acid-binding protein